jgi:DNA repair protein RadA/Sms
MVLAVLERRAGLKVSDKEVYASTVGGVRLAEPATDLSLALAIASSISDRPLPGRTVVLGEVGLAGEIRRVGGAGRRLAEAARQGYTSALVPPGSGAAPDGMRVREVSDIGEALATLARSPRVVAPPTGLADVVQLAPSAHA